MVNYSNSKIYKIWSLIGDKIYIGSTTKEYLSQRMDKHRSQYKSYKNGKSHNVSSFILFDEYGLENCKIELLEAKECNSKDELRQLEGKYIRDLECVNKCIAGRTKKEWIECNKEYFINYQIKWREDNKDKIKEDDKIRYQKNKEELFKKIICQCGGSYCKATKIKHFKTNKHQKNIK